MGEDSSIMISLEDIKAFEKLKLISEIAPLKERIRSFERKYSCDLKDFEAELKLLTEDFERWDDFIEWKAYADSVKDLEARLRKVEDATNFRIAPG
jgi:predicted  nucleic acid-binding Zn-ribbon protein